jgi:hypothetical protein
MALDPIGARSQRAFNRAYKKRMTKRRAAKKNTPTYKTPKNVASATTSNTGLHRAVTLKPFVYHQGNPHPKIPDGKMEKSLGRRFKQVDSISITGDATVFVYPSFGCVATIHGGVNKGITDGDQKVHHLLSSTSCFLTNSEGGSTLAQATGSMWLREATQVNRRRIVSQGLRLSLTNDDQTNDGWFEAYRVPFKRVLDGTLTLINPTTYSNDPAGNMVGNVAICYDKPKVFFDEDSVSRLQNSSYKTGLLRDISKLEFNVKHTTTDRDPVTAFSTAGVLLKGAGYVPTQQSAVAPNFINTMEVDYIWSAGSTGRALLQNTATIQGIYSQMFDFGMDIVVIHIHAGNSGSNFLVEGIQNIESVHESDSAVAPYQTHSDKDPDIDMHLGDHDNGAPAGEPRTGG